MFVIKKSTKSWPKRTGFTMNKILGNNVILLCSALGKANTWEKYHFRMPFFVLSKCATPKNQHLERRMFTSKSYADLPMQNSFKNRSTQPDMARYIFIEQFTLKVWYTAKLTQALICTGNFPSTLHDELNSLEKSCTFQGKCSYNAENFICDL